MSNVIPFHAPRTSAPVVAEGRILSNHTRAEYEAPAAKAALRAMRAAWLRIPLSWYKTLERERLRTYGRGWVGKQDPQAQEAHTAMIEHLEQVFCVEFAERLDALLNDMADYAEQHFSGSRDAAELAKQMRAAATNW